MNDSLATNLQRALRFTFKSGSLVYILITAVIFCLICTDNLEYALKHHVPRDPLSPGGTALILQTIALLLLLYKLLDNSERMRLGLDDEPVSFAPVSVISGTLPLRLTGLGLLVMIALGFVAAALAFMQSRTGLQLLGGLVLLAGFILNPAITLAMLKTDTASAAFSPRQWGDAISDIGAGRYFALLGIAVALIAVAILFIVFLIAPAMQQNLVAGVMQQAMSGKSKISVPGTMYIYYLLIGLVLMTLAFFNQHLYASAFPREDSDDPESFSYGMNAAEMESISAALAGHGVTPPTAEDKSAAPAAAAEAAPDFSLLADADTSGMDIDTQKAFAFALARADALLGSNKIDAGLALLAPYADGAHDAAAFFPAYRRIYALKPEYELLQRLAAAAAHGHAPSFELIRPELERIDPATLPADLIYPLAQFAARQQHYPVVLTLTRGFAQHHPDHPQLIDNYLLAARALAKTGHAERAQQLLTQMLTRFASHEKAGQIRATLNLLQQQG